MSDLFLGRHPDSKDQLQLDPSRLRTHGVVVGMTGSGKTGLCLVMLEELVRSGVPIVAIDPKGDLGNLGLVFPELRPEDFKPWAGGQDAEKIASRWRSGLEAEGLVPDAISDLRSKLDLTVYTPGSESGVPVNLLGSLSRPAGLDGANEEAARELVADTVSGLLGLVGRTADPVKDPAHVVLSYIVQSAWAAGDNLDLETLIMRLVDPPFEKVGVFPVDRFFPPDDRMDLAMTFNAVVASPTFTAWTKGATLDITSMLAPTEGRTKVHVFSLAHLDEAERQFFVSLLSGRMLAWSRQQPGTDDLRALMFFDEVAGFLPPHPKQPASKRPLLTIMKQSRAVGLGVVLSTQNPVDVDYKALSNAGTWCIGRLNTAQDRKRLLDGIDGSGLDSTVAGLEKRQFLLHQIGRGEPSVFGTRYAMCFLRGPLTRVEVSKVNDLYGTSQPAAPAGAAAKSAPKKTERAAAPAVKGVDRWYVDPRVVFAARLEGVFEQHAEPKRDDGRIQYRPALYAEVGLRFDEDRVGFVEDRREHRVWFPLGDGPGADPVVVNLEADDLTTEPPDEAVYADLPGWLDESKEHTALKKRIVDDIYRGETTGMFVNKKLKLYGRAGETREDFDARCSKIIEDEIDEAIGKLREKYETKGERLQDKIETKRAKLAETEGLVKSRQLDEAVNIGATLLSFFGGRKTGASRAITKRRQTSRASHKMSQLEEEIARYEEDAADLLLELDNKIEALREKAEEKLEATEEKSVRLEKSDVRLERYGILWVPTSRRI